MEFPVLSHNTLSYLIKLTRQEINTALDFFHIYIYCTDTGECVDIIFFFGLQDNKNKSKFH